MEKTSAGEKIGGPGKIVCIDESHLTKAKRNKGGFQGRRTVGHKTIMMGGVELNGSWSGRKQTGRAFLVVIRDQTALTFQEVIEKHVAPGTTIWTDGASSYAWLDRDERFTHETVIHRRGEFSRMRADGVKVPILFLK